MDHEDARAIVAALHVDLLQRNADAATLECLAHELAEHGDCSRVLHELLTRDEFLDRTVTEAYVHLIGRAPDVNELEHEKSTIRAGSTWVCDVGLRLLEQVADGGSTTFGLFIGLVYDAALGREVTVAEADHWWDRHGTGSRRALVREIWDSREAANHRIAELYRTHLWRNPDPAGLVTWHKILQSSGDEPIRAGLVSSLEYSLLAKERFATNEASILGTD